MANVPLPSCRSSSIDRSKMVANRRRDIYQELETLKTRTQSLNYEMNSLAYIHSLPSEVLSRVFFHVVPPEWDDPSFFNLSFRWTAITHVCHRWRTVALDFAALWSTIPSNNLCWTREMLARSKRAPLFVSGDFRSFDTKKKKMANILHSLLNHASRIEVFRMRVNREDVLGLDRRLDRPAPRLTSLCLFGDTSQPAVATFDVFAGSTPSLRRLSLHSIFLDWRSSHFRNLTDLTIHCVPSTGTPTTAELASILRSSPQLRSLDLEHCLPVAHGEGPLYCTVVNLPFLSTLALRDVTSHCVNVLKHISYAPHVELTLGCLPDPEMVDFAAVFPYLAPQFERGGDFGAPVSSLSLFGATHGLIVTAWLVTGDANLSVDYAPFRFKLACVSHNPDLVRILSVLRESLALHQLSHLMLDRFPEKITLDKIMDALGELPNLEGLYTTHITAKDVISTLMLRLTSFPMLRRLSLAYADFGAKGSHVEYLRVCLNRRRVEHGQALERLQLDECTGLNEERVNELCSAVASVEWDGVVRVRANDEEGYENLETMQS